MGLRPDGTQALFTSSAALDGAAMLDHEGAHELTQEQFEDLTKTACHRLTVCTTNNTFHTLAFVLTRGNEVSQWFLNVAAVARPTSVVLTNTFGGGSRPRPHLKERQSVKSSMRFSPATSVRRSRLEDTVAVVNSTR